MNQQTQDAITDLAKEHGWGELHTGMLREACHNVCAERVKLYVSRAPVGLAPTNIECPIHGQRPCNATERRERVMRHIGYAVKYTEGVGLIGKFWGKDEYGRWVVSSSPFVFTKEEDADQAVAAPEPVKRIKIKVFVED